MGGRKIWLVVLCAALAVILIFSQIKYIEPFSLYTKNRDVFDESVRQLKTVLSDVEKSEENIPYGDASAEKIDCSLYSEINVTVYRLKEEPEPGYNSNLDPQWGPVYSVQSEELDLDVGSDLYLALSALKELGIRAVQVFDFTAEERYADEAPSPYEVWYVFGAGKRLIYSENGKITPDGDVTEGGYGLNSRKISAYWFAGDSFYDSDSDFWKG